MMLEGLIALSLRLHFGKLKGLPRVVKYGIVIQHHCSGCSQVQVGPYLRGLPAFPPTLWPNSYGLTPYLVIWHGAHPGFRSNGLMCWMWGLAYALFLAGHPDPGVAVCNQSAQPLSLPLSTGTAGNLEAALVPSARMPLQGQGYVGAARGNLKAMGRQGVRSQCGWEQLWLYLSGGDRVELSQSHGVLGGKALPSIGLFFFFVRATATGSARL